MKTGLHNSYRFPPAAPHGNHDTIQHMIKSARWWSLTGCVIYLGIAVLLATAASSREMCGDGDLRPSCPLFAAGVVLYGALAIGAITTLVVLVGVLIKRRVSQLLKAAAILCVSALLLFILPVLATGNKLGGIIVGMAVLPVSLVLLSAASICIALWAGRAWATKLSGHNLSHDES